MNHPLDGARLKIIRAQEHLDSLRAEIGMYMSDDPYTVGVAKVRDGFEITPVVRIDPLLRLSTIVGDCVTNSRAALDYIEWELAIRSFRDPPFNSQADRWVQFPLTNDPARAAYAERLKRLEQRQIPVNAINAIREVQPHNAGYESLWWLHELVNADKHRSPLLTIGVASHMHDVSGIGSRGTFIKTASSTRSWIRGVASDEEMQVDGEATGFVAFGDVAIPRKPVDAMLEEMIKTVLNILPRFYEFLA